MLKSVWNFIAYWHFRYLLVTELFMVEKWERVMFHIVFAIIFSIMSLFNTTVVLGLVSRLTQPMFLHDAILQNSMQDSSALHSEF